MKNHYLYTLLMAAVLTTGCGGGAFRENISSSASNAGSSTVAPVLPAFIPNPAYDFPTMRMGPYIASARSSSNSANWAPTANNCGPNCLKFSVTTQTKLRVRVRAIDGVAYIKDSLTSFPSQYGCVSYQINVGNQTIQTPLLRVPGANSNATAQCAGAPSEFIADLSNAVGCYNAQCLTEVRITNPQYDLYCNYYSGTSYNGQKCPSVPLYQNNQVSPYSWHEVKVQVGAETNGTSF